MALWSEAGVEPTLNELLSDPLVEIITRYDRLSRDDVKRAVRVAQARLHGVPKLGKASPVA